MIVVRDVRTWVCGADSLIVEALERISANKAGVVFLVETDGLLAGVLTDGDFRRWVAGQRLIDLHRPVRSIANLAPTSAPAETPLEQLAQRFSARIAHIPLVDSRGRLVAVATTRNAEVRIGDRVIDDEAPALLVAEIGINHNGSLATALELVDAAADAGADCAKFQLRDMASLYRNEGRVGDAGEDLGSQYTLDLLGRFALTNNELFSAMDRCRERGLLPLCTPWDIESVQALDAYGVPAFKTASADLTNHELLDAIASRGRPVLVSTGMSTESEILESVRLLQRRAASYVLLLCNSTYPAPFHDVNLRYLERLREMGAAPVGYSGHERGWHVAVAAVALGARVIEKHITLDRAMEGNDHNVSLLPGEFAHMVSDIRELEEALGSARPRVVSQGEMMNRVTLAKSLVAVADLVAGHVVTSGDVDVKSPGRGLQPNRRAELVGRTLARPVKAGDFFYPSDLDEVRAEPRAYSFRRPWGIPVRYHDAGALVKLCEPDFVEFHLSYQDMDLDLVDYVPDNLGTGLVVHSPELFRGDHILDLAADDADYRRRSIDELRRVVDVTLRLRSHLGLEAAHPTLIVANLGGFSTDGPLPVTDRPGLYDRLAEGLSSVGHADVEVIAQTLPPFPWFMGGQTYSNLFVDPDDTVAFASATASRICLDVSHSKLACNHRRASFKEFVDIVGPHVAHLHLVDASGVDGEGVQVGEGEVDWPVLAEQLDRYAPYAGFIPEIWQGHKNEGEGFWTALDRLEDWFGAR